MRKVAVAISLALTAALVRLVPLGWLHPLQWDEVEFFRATDWIRRGLVPYRDFWEHHSPLPWMLFAPFTALTDSPGVDAVLLLRWVQIPVWIATFWLMAIWMRRAGLDAFARWTAIGFALCASFLMTSAVEYRVDPTATMLYVAGLVLAQRDSRRTAFFAGVVFCLAGFANLRLGPLLALTVLLLRVVDAREQKWGGRMRANWLFVGVIAMLGVAGVYFLATSSLLPFVQQVFIDNYRGDKYAEGIAFGFIHRLLVPFGVRLLGAGLPFDLAGVDAGGIAVLVLGFAGLVRALRSWRRPDDLFVLAFLALVNLLFIAVMKFVYHYHFQSVVILMLPFIALTVARLGRPRLVLALLVVAWCVNLFASVFRGKELDRAYQDLILREVHARTRPGDKVFDGVGWALRREPAYRFWFLPDLARQLVRHGHAAPYSLRDFFADPPAAVIPDRNALNWMAENQGLGRLVTRHYIPVWRNLWIPGPNVLLTPSNATFAWIVPADGEYRLYASEELARHPWFARSLYVGAYDGPGAERLQLTLPEPAPSPRLAWRANNAPLDFSRGAVRLKKGDSLVVIGDVTVPLGVILMPANDRQLFRQPPPGVTLEAASPRVTHWPW
ncbi:MAG TPA: hypothetical protein VF618_28230 [Thermoanaerobaculia bacterium]